jgi:hypothetical protein
VRTLVGERWRTLENDGERWRTMENVGERCRALENIGEHWVSRALEVDGARSSVALECGQRVRGGAGGWVGVVGASARVPVQGDGKGLGSLGSLEFTLYSGERGKAGPFRRKQRPLLGSGML